MLRIREVVPRFNYEADREIRSFDVKLVHGYAYGEVVVTVKVADKRLDETILNLAYETAYEELRKLAAEKVPLVKIGPPSEAIEPPAVSKPDSSD